MEIFIPKELAHEERHIKRFFDAMIAKLRKNAHKTGFAEASLDQCITRMHGEADELRVAIEEGNVIEIVLEAADVANFAMIASVAAIEGRRESMHDLYERAMQYRKVKEEDVLEDTSLNKMAINSAGRQATREETRAETERLNGGQLVGVNWCRNCREGEVPFNPDPRCPQCARMYRG